MPTITAAETRFRPAGIALEDGLLGTHADLERLAEDQRRLHEAVASLVARMNEPSIDDRDLDRLTRAVSQMLVVAEDLRQVRAKTASRRTADGRAWRTRLALD